MEERIKESREKENKVALLSVKNGEKIQTLNMLCKTSFCTPFLHWTIGKLRKIVFALVTLSCLNLIRLN